LIDVFGVAAAAFDDVVAVDEAVTEFGGNRDACQVVFEYPTLRRFRVEVGEGQLEDCCVRRRSGGFTLKRGE
jgi:hypothetical protein